MSNRFYNRTAALVLSCLLPFLADCAAEKETAGAAKPPACVIDIDGTIVHEKRPLPGAVETLRWIDRKGISIFYLTGRLAFRLSKTDALLKKFGFPSGAGLILRADPEEETVTYKSREIRKIQKRYNVLFGIGDKKSDRDAYRACGIIVFHRITSWEEVRIRINRILKEKGY